MKTLPVHRFATKCIANPVFTNPTQLYPTAYRHRIYVMCADIRNRARANVHALCADIRNCATSCHGMSLHVVACRGMNSPVVARHISASAQHIRSTGHTETSLYLKLICTPKLPIAPSGQLLVLVVLCTTGHVCNLGRPRPRM